MFILFVSSYHSLLFKSNQVWFKSQWPPASVNWSSRVLDRSARKPRCQKAKCYVRRWPATWEQSSMQGWRSGAFLKKVVDFLNEVSMLNRKKGGRLYRFTGPGVKYELYAFIFLSTQKQGTIIVYSCFSSINCMHHMYVGVNGCGWKLGILSHALICFVSVGKNRTQRPMMK